MDRWIDITGRKFGYWTVIRCVGSGKFQTALWECLCKCGNRKIVEGTSLRTGRSTSCGCSRKKPLKHGDSMKSSAFFRLYKVWSGLKMRSGKLKETSRNYETYKHVRICSAWKKYPAFKSWALS